MAATARRRRVLIIEDNVDAADSLREALELCRHRVEVAYNGPDGMAKARVFRPEVVLCDIGLPGMDGYEVARAIRADESLAGVRLVAVSGYAQPEDRARATRAGFDAHVAKPADPSTIERLLV
jgi:CheY-like chemotaxis protein